MTVGIVGLGLIGGSLAKAFKRVEETTVLGYDIEESTVLRAVIENAITADEIKTRTGLKRRDITRSIQRERLAGKPICATNDSHNPGYFLTDDPAELQRYITTLDRRVREIRKTRSAMQKTMHRIESETEQLSMIVIEIRPKSPSLQ